MHHDQNALDSFSLFQFENWNWMMLFVLILIGIIYFSLIGPFRSRFSDATPVRVGTIILFLTGLLLYGVAMGSPLAKLAHRYFSAHMGQMTILYLVMPPILLKGLPVWLVRTLSQRKIFKTLGSFLTKPLIALLAFNGALSIYHVPVIFDTIMQIPSLQILSHVILQFLAFCMWWVLVCPIPELDRVKPLHKIAYIIGNAVLLTPACALIIFADEPLFGMFSNASLGSGLPLNDQALGGIIMKITQEAVFIVMLVYIFIQWVRKERLRDQQDQLEMKQGS